MRSLKIFIFSFVFGTLFCWGAQAQNTGLNADILKLTVYKMAVSTSPLCTNLITVMDNGNSPTEVDFASGTVSLGSGSVANGTYPCIVIEFSSYIKFSPSTTSTATNCAAATEYTMDVCPSGTSVLVDGTTSTCAASTDNKVAMYISTASTSSTGVDAFNAPTSLSDATKGFTLGASLSVTGTASGKFIVNPDGKVCDGDDAGCDGGGNGGQCRMEPPSFSFSI